MLSFFQAWSTPRAQVVTILVLAFLAVLMDASILLGLIVFGLIVVPPAYDPAIRWKLEQEKKGN